MQLKIESVSKQYKGSDVFALHEIDMDVGYGILGLLGPNGAGKSTLMRIIATITKPSMGTVLWNGTDIKEKPDSIRSVLGYLPQDFGVYPNLNADEFLRYMATIKGVESKAANERIENLLTFVDLLDSRRRPLGEYSGGMKQRIGIAQALLNDPMILIIDEPTVGLDPEGRTRFRNLLAELAGERIVILSTHIVSDIEATATDIVVINQGKLLTRSSPEDFLKIVDGRVWDWIVPSSELPMIKERYLLSGILRRKEGLHIRIVSEERPSDDAQQIASPTLEDAYLYCIYSNRGEGI
ncbi:MAG: ABC transporter ATP-binding protein [Candidatus Thorarchaeota archaeon]